MYGMRPKDQIARFHLMQGKMSVYMLRHPKNGIITSGVVGSIPNKSHPTLKPTAEPQGM